MSSRDEKKKNQGPFFRGKSNNEGCGPKPSTSDANKNKANQKGNTNKSDKFKSQGTQGNQTKQEANKHQTNVSNKHVTTQKKVQGNEGKQEANKHQTNVSNKHAIAQKKAQGNEGKQETNKHQTNVSYKHATSQKKTEMQNTSLSELFSGNQGVNLLNQISTNTNLTHIAVNVYSSNFTSQFNQSSSLSSVSHANQTRGFHRKPNPGSHSQFPSKKYESPAEIRVFNSCQKSNVQNHTFKALSYSGQGQTPNFPQAHNSGKIPFEQQTPVHLQQTWNSGRGQFRKQNPINRAERHFSPRHQGVNYRFISPGTSNVRLKNPQIPNPFVTKPTNRFPVNKSKSTTPCFSQTHLNENSLTKAAVHSNLMANTVSLKSAPVYKFAKTSQPKKTSSQRNFNKNQNTKVKSAQGKTSQKTRGNWNKPEWRQKKKTNKEFKPLFSFQCTPVKTETQIKEVDSEEDNDSASVCSSEGSFWSTNISNDEMDDISDDSEATSEVSMISSIKDSEFSEDIGLSSKETGVISVFWDIENCPIPHGKSGVDFVKLVRTMLYENRIEGSFSVVCDVHNLNNTQTDELSASNVTICHMSSTNKNAADTKLKSFLYDFLELYKGRTGCAIVLISGDSDFADTLNTLRFRYNIYINLICKNNARHSLVESAHRCIFYEDFIKQLPVRSLADDTDYLIIVSNFPKNMKKKQIRSALSSRLKSVNCRVKNINEISGEIVLPDDCARDKALTLLKNFIISGNEIKTESSERKKNIHSTTLSKSAKSKISKTESVVEVKSKLEEKTFQNFNEESAHGGKYTTLCICVGERLSDIEYWKKELEKLWNLTDFNLQWEGNVNDGYFLANFKTLKKAQKAKKILLKTQNKELTSPKFLKLIKQDDILNNLQSFNSIQDINGKKITDHIQIIESKKKVCLSKHKQCVAQQKAFKSSVLGANEAVIEKLNELNDQQVTFLNYTQNIIDKIKNIHVESEEIDQILTHILHDYSRECNCLSTALPIYGKKNAILKKVKKHQVVVIRAETGSGKSTQLTQYIWREQNVSQNGLIVCTQPRKIAAVSLAKHVSTQVGCALGDIVGYEVGITTKKSSNTAILYVTDFTMLNMMANKELKDIGCIIVDEAHERTVYTDLLLGMIQSCLKVRPDLKLIITSATIDTTVFKNYFQIPDEAIIEVTGRNFPIEDIWLDQSIVLGWDYFKKTIDTVYSILDQDPGDILAFLTTPLETERAMNALIGKFDTKLAQNVKIFQLHGKLDVQEHQKIFERLPNSSRKVVFATNCAETSVTIPGIKYVVDCGIVKESQYDSITNMNIMSVNFVSQNSAEQRRGHAGRTQIGKCYRLYSKINYEKMNKTSEPEILRVNLGQALLKLMKLGVNDPLQFDFVQSPPQEVLRSSMQQLLDLKAVNLFDLSLSTLGEYMSCLPLEPRLSFMVLKGIDLNIAWEAIILAALVTVSRNICFRTAQNETAAHVKKMRFSHESDFLTYFEVYREWVTVPKLSKSKWCVLNCINATFLRTAHNLVNEVIYILQKEIKLKVSTKFNDESVHDSLLKLIFCSFYQNLCIFSGHHRFGYRSLGVPGDLSIHPSSSLYTYGHWRPKFLVYDALLKTEQTYLINVSPIDRDSILECMDIYGLNVNLAEFEALPLIEFGISPIGKTILLHDIMGKRGACKKQLENQLRSVIGSSNVIVDIDVQKGEVKVCGPQDKYDEIAAILCPVVETAQERLLKEEKEVLVYPELRAILSTGIAIKEVLLPGEFRDVKVILNTDIKIESAVEKLQTCGQIATVREFRNYFKITFVSLIEAKQAFKMFSNEEAFTLQTIFSTKDYHSRINQYKVHVSFLRRECTGEAYISTEPPLSSNVHMTSFYQNRLLNTSICKNTLDLRITGIPPDTEKYDFEKFLKSELPPETKITKCLIVRKKVYDSFALECENIKQKLVKLFSEFTAKDKFSINLMKPASKDFRWNAWVFFQNPSDGETAVSVLKTRKIDGVLDFKMKTLLQTNLYCKKEVFTAVVEQIAEALKFFKENANPGNTLEIEAFPKEEIVQIKITGNNISDITNCRKSILNFLLGDEFKCSDNTINEKLFSKAGQAYIKKISEANSKCHIEMNIQKRVLKIFGNEFARNLLKVEINDFLSQLAEQNFKEIVLMDDNEKPGVLRELLNKYGFDLEKLKTYCGLTSIELNSHQHILRITGSNIAITNCQQVVQDIKMELGNTVYNENTELCPVCFDKISNDFHRLEYCGHAYCRECILHWLQTSNDFPLSCLTCESPLVVQDIYWVTKEVKSFDVELYQKALTAFVNIRDDISYCPSPDCSMIYRTSNNDDDNNNAETVFLCPLCSNSICTQCQEFYHYGMSCNLNKLCKADSDYSLKMWLQADPNNHKSCPSCSAPIEKNGGCNHMTCWKCKCDMCWLCLQVFPNAELVYNHQANCPRQQIVQDLLTF